MSNISKVITSYSILYLIILILISNYSFSLKLKIKNPRNHHFDIDLYRIQPDSENYLNHLKSSSLLSTSLLQTFGYSALNLHKAHSSYYIGYIYVGQPPQIIPVVFDTGSGYTWLASKYCISNTLCKGVESYYDSDKSKNHKDLEISLKISFGKGKLEGKFCSDVIALSSDLIILNEPIGEIFNIEDNILLKGGISGIIGLSYNTTSLLNHTLFDGLISSAILSRNVISFHFDDIKGQINFGYIDANKYYGNLYTHKVIDKYYWTLKLTDFKINDQSIILCASEKCGVILDSGSSGIIMSPILYKKFIKDNLIEVNTDCSGIDILPKIKILIDDKEYFLEPQDYVFKHLDKNTRKEECALNVIPLSIPRFEGNMHVILLGENFIKNYYTVFDRDNDQVHFGLKRK